MSEPDVEELTRERAESVGGENALSLVYVRWSPLIYTFALRSLGNMADAEDVTRDVFLTDWKGRSALDASRPLPGWLMTTARSRVADALAERAGDAEDGALPPVVTSAQPDLGDRLLIADELAHLKPNAQRVMRLVLNEGLSHQQAAARLRLTRDAVKGHIRASLDRMRRTVGGSSSHSHPQHSNPDEHSDREQLALMALGEPTFSKVNRAHLAGCNACRTDLRELTEAARLGRAAIDVGVLVRPNARVWDAISEEISRPAPVITVPKAPLPIKRILTVVGLAVAIAAVLAIILIGWNLLAPT